MKRIVKLTEADLTNIIKRIVEENEMVSYDGGGINDVMNMAYDYMSDNCPEGPKNRELYMKCIEELDGLFQYTIRNLKGNVGM